MEGIYLTFAILIAAHCVQKIFRKLAAFEIKALAVTGYHIGPVMLKTGSNIDHRIMLLQQMSLLSLCLDHISVVNLRECYSL
jgi:Ni,Fe-hydrogenase I cytochrome b subunit